jgi:hypothetical protein
MTYSLPELVLVGAAQNLVLDGSLDKFAACTPGPRDEDASVYDGPATW